MLDPRFEYDPCVSLGGETELEDNLIRDRFHFLWDTDIQARLLKKGFLPAKNTHQNLLRLARGSTRAQKEKEKCPQTL